MPTCIKDLATLYTCHCYACNLRKLSVVELETLAGGSIKKDCLWEFNVYNVVHCIRCRVSEDLIVKYSKESNTIFIPAGSSMFIIKVVYIIALT